MFIPRSLIGNSLKRRGEGGRQREREKEGGRREKPEKLVFIEGLPLYVAMVPL